MSLRKREDSPAPRTVDTTGTFDGNDGEWSTFYINVGDKDNNGGGQNFKVLPSTWLGVTVVPFTADWCNQDCAQDRGVGQVKGSPVRGLATSPDSTTWKDAGVADLAVPTWDFNGTSVPTAAYGLDYLGIGQGSPKSWVVPDMYVAGTQSKDFYLGQFGLGPGSTNVGSRKDAVDSFISSMKASNIIPSISYSYTAGAKYRNNDRGVTGSLVLGGYDEMRINPDNRVSIKMPNEKNTTLIVGVQDISYKPDVNVDANVFSLTEKNVKGFSATIDSTWPYLWLPGQVCDEFAKRFNLKYDNKTNFYNTDLSGAQNNAQQNATVSFKIGDDPFGGGNGFTNIVLPYSAFDLKYRDPSDSDNEIRRFAIRKSPDGRFVLGRTLLQEAYIIVDYERSNFTVAAASFPDSPSTTKLVPIYDKSYVPPTPTPLPTGGGGGGLSGGAIAGIVVGILVVALGAAFAIFMWWKKRRERNAPPPDYSKATEIDTAAAGNEVKHRRVSELESQTPGLPKPGPNGYYGDNRDGKTLEPFPTISEMDSPPAELYSPPAVASTPHTEGNSTADYFTVGGKLGRHNATREPSSNNHTPGTPPPFTPMAELPGEDVGYRVGRESGDAGLSEKGSPVLRSISAHRRDPSATPSQNNIDEVMKRQSAEPSPARPAKGETAIDGTTGQDKKAETDIEEEPLERRPSHTRGLSDTTVHSDTTVVSQPTPEELREWAQTEDEHPRRPLSE